MFQSKYDITFNDSTDMKITNNNWLNMQNSYHDMPKSEFFGGSNRGAHDTRLQNTTSVLPSAKELASYPMSGKTTHYNDL